MCVTTYARELGFHSKTLNKFARDFHSVTLRVNLVTPTTQGVSPGAIFHFSGDILTNIVGLDKFCWHKVKHNSLPAAVSILLT